MDLERNDLLRILAGILLVLGWILVPLYLQLEHNFSAIKASFGITVIYYLVYRLWKWRKESATV